MKQLISKTQVDALPLGGSIVDTKIDGFIARKLPSGKITYGFRYRGTHSKQWWLSLGVHGQSGVTADSARALAKVFQGKVAAGADPGADKQALRVKEVLTKKAAKSTVNELLDNFVARHVDKNLRSAATVKRSFDVYVRPEIGAKSIYELRRKDIVDLLDKIVDNQKAVTADRVLAYLRKAFNWHEINDEDFRSPIIKGMARTKPSEHARSRFLSDDEIRSVWTALESSKSGPEPFRNMVRVLLLTAQRRDEIGLMRAEELDGDTFIIPGERYKTKIDNAVPLTAAARRWIGNLKAGFMFSTTGGQKPFSGYSKAKDQLDAVINAQRKEDGLKPMPEWRLHDLRRTARSLMSRAGVSADIAEMVLGHKLLGVRGVYDRYSYAAEKRDALEKLAGLITQILAPQTNNIVRIA